MTAEREGSDIEIEVAKNREYWVVKSNELINCVAKRKYGLSALEQRALAFIISQIKPPEAGESEPSYVYTFDIRQFCRVCGIDCDNGKNYLNVKEALTHLAAEQFWIDEGDSLLQFQWIYTPRIHKKSGHITVRISEDVMPYLWNLQERFTKYQLYQILALKSAHSIALYEIFKSNLFKKKITISIDDLKNYLSISDKYTEYKNFRRKVLEPAIREINQFTDLDIAWEPIKQGRRYAQLKFIIKQKDQWEGVEAYRRTIAALEGISYSPGQMSLFE